MLSLGVTSFATDVREDVQSKMAELVIGRLFEKNPMTGNNGFHEIIIDGSLTLLQRIQNNINEPLDFYLREYNNQGVTCLHLAAFIPGHRRAIRFMDILRSLGADINERSLITGQTVLHYAVHQKRYKLTKWLCDLPEIDVCIRNNAGETPTAVAIKLKVPKLVRQLFRAQIARENIETRINELLWTINNIEALRSAE